MTTMRSAFDISRSEPNWREVEEISYLDEGRYGYVAFLDRWGYKAADNRDCNRDYEFEEDWENAFSEGYLLTPPYGGMPMTEEEFEDLTDPDYGKSDVYQGPYFIDQPSNGRFIFHGPTGIAPGPSTYVSYRGAEIGTGLGGYFLYA